MLWLWLWFLCPGSSRGSLLSGLLRHRADLPDAFLLWAVAGGVEIWVHARPHRADLVEEGLNLGIHLSHSLRVCERQVIPFADVLAEVKKLPAVGARLAAVEDADQFPVALVHRHRRRDG